MTRYSTISDDGNFVVIRDSDGFEIHVSRQLWSKLTNDKSLLRIDNLAKALWLVAYNNGAFSENSDAYFIEGEYTDDDAQLFFADISEILRHTQQDLHNEILVVEETLLSITVNPDILQHTFATGESSISDGKFFVTITDPDSFKIYIDKQVWNNLQYEYLDLTTPDLAKATWLVAKSHNILCEHTDTEAIKGQCDDIEFLATIASEINDMLEQLNHDELKTHIATCHRLLADAKFEFEPTTLLEKLLICH